MDSTIKFLRINPYRRAIGSLDTGMGYGVHQALVQRGIAEFVPEMQLDQLVPDEPVDAEQAAEPSRSERRNRRTLSQ